MVGAHPRLMRARRSGEGSARAIIEENSWFTRRREIEKKVVTKTSGSRRSQQATLPWPTCLCRVRHRSDRLGNPPDRHTDDVPDRPQRRRSSRLGAGHLPKKVVGAGGGGGRGDVVCFLQCFRIGTEEANRTYLYTCRSSKSVALHHSRLSRTKSGGQRDGSKPMRCDCTPFSFASLRFACVARPRDARAWVKTKQKTPPPEKSILCVVSIVHSRGTAWPEQHQNTSSPFARPPSTSDIPRGPRTSPPVPKTAAAAAAVAASLISAKSMSSSDSRSTAQT